MYLCRRIRLCTYLLENGFMYERESIDIKNPKFKVWVFSDSKKLRDAIESYYAGVPKKVEKVGNSDGRNQSSQESKSSNRSTCVL